MKSLLPVMLLLGLILPRLYGQQVKSSAWHAIQIDSTKGKWGDWATPEWLRYFGLDMGDVNQDGDADVLSGRYLYINPGGDMTAEWKRLELPDNVDGIFIMDVDGDAYADLIAQALPDIYWYEAIDKAATRWEGRKIGTVPATGHVNSQGFERGQIIPGATEEFVIAGNGDLYLFQIPEQPEQQPWPRTLIGENTSDEGISLGDIDGDGDLDIAAGRPDEHGALLSLVWFENPGQGQSPWKNRAIGQSHHPIDRVEIGDFNGDGRADVAVSEERWPGKEPDGNLFWWEQPADPSTDWPRHHIVTQYSMNNLDVSDLDGDGDLDLVTNEHKGPRLETQLWENDGTGQFTKHLIDTGRENHLGTQLYDLNGDGDLDLIGAAWDHYQNMYIWRNDFINQRFSWKHLSTARGELPPTNGGQQQTASLVADVNNDGVNDIFTTDRSVTPSVVGHIYDAGTWQRYVIDEEPLRIEAASAAYDIDGDGDTDLVFGGESQSNEIWWWENSYPTLQPDQPWHRRTIKKSGKNKHHDIAFIDFDGDGQQEFVFWNQGAHGLFYAEIPANPREVQEWAYKPVYTHTTDGEMAPRSTYPGWRGTNEHEGLFGIDMNGDGVDDILGGGRWFEYQEGTFREHIIDASYTFTRAVGGQLIEGGKPEVVMVVGDGEGPLLLYQWEEGFWRHYPLIEHVSNGHTLDIKDFDGDGHLDIFSAEMRFGEGNPDSEILILLGDGKGHFTRHVVARGFGVHEGRLTDLDGDGDLDILGKPYSWQAPRLDIWLNTTK